jgi:hypothetical protein
MYSEFVSSYGIDLTNGFQCNNRGAKMHWESNRGMVYPCCRTNDDTDARTEAAQRLAKLSTTMETYEKLFSQLETDESVRKKMLENASQKQVEDFEQELVEITQHLRKTDEILEKCNEQYLFSSPFFTGDEYFDSVNGKMCVPMKDLADHIEGDIIPLLLDAEDTFSKFMTGTTPHRNVAKSKWFLLSLKKGIHRKGAATQLGKIVVEA